MKPYLIFLFLSWVCLAEIIPSGSRITWDPGVRGGIPNRTTVFTNMAASKTAAQIQSALDDCPSNQVVLLTNSTFTINATLTIPTGVTLRGAGISNTVLNGAASFTGDRFIDFNNSFDYDFTGSAKSLVGCSKGSTSIETSSAHGFSVGDIVLIDMLEQTSGDPPINNTGYGGTATWVSRSSGNRPCGQCVKIESTPTSTTATISPPLYWAYNNTPQALKLTGITHYAGVESLTVNNLSSACTDTVGTWGAINCWLNEVELKGNSRRAMWGYTALWFEMRKCRVTGGIPIGDDRDAQYTSDSAYGPFLGVFTAGLLTDSIFEKLTMAVALEGPASGNVISYNMMTNIWWSDTGSDWPIRFGVLMHGPHPFMNLVEGNVASKFRADFYWGTGSHFTCLRNRFAQHSRGTPPSQNWLMDIESSNWYYNFVGNLLGGGDGTGETVYELNGATYDYESGPYVLWKTGYEGIGGDNTGHDTSVMSTSIRWGNWCYRTNNSSAGSGITWHTENVSDSDDYTIPDSYYLASKPSFFKSLTWPPYDPSSPTLNSPTNIPAGYRYVYGEDPPEESSQTRRGTLNGKISLQGKGSF